MVQDAYPAHHLLDLPQKVAGNQHRGPGGFRHVGNEAPGLAEDGRAVLPEGGSLPLTAMERALLRKLAENRGHIVTYDALCAAVWGADYYGYENSLGVHIRHLREKLEKEPSRPQALLTVRGIGYKLAKEEQA